VKNKNNLKLLLSQFLVLGSVLSFQTALAYCQVWPQTDRRNTYLVFSPDRVTSFAKVYGLKTETVPLPSVPQTMGLAPVVVDQENSFEYWVPKTAKNQSIQCIGGSSGKGSAMTSLYLLPRARKLSVALPIKVTLQSAFVGAQKQQLLAAPLLKVSIVTGGEGNTLLRPLEQVVKVYRLGDFIEGPGDDTVPLHIQYEKILVVEPQMVPDRKKFAIRIEWNTEALCQESLEVLNETPFYLGIGDQFRLLNPI
jgi:hypothetical protein